MSYSDIEDVEYLNQLQCKEDRLKFIFGPFEKYICALESVLTWEYPVVFVLLLAFCNCLFWMYSITPFYCLIGIGGFMALGVQFVIGHILPRFTDAETSEEWVKVPSTTDDNLDLIHCLAVMTTKFEKLYQLLETCKKENRDKFNLFGILGCTFLFALSCAISESYLVYCTVMGLLLWPGLKYNKITDRIYNVVKPRLDAFERKMGIQRTVSAGEDGPDDDSNAELQPFLPADESSDFFPFSPTSLENGDDSDTNEDFMPHVGDSRDATDDEIVSEELSLATQDVNFDKTPDLEADESSDDEIVGNSQLEIPDSFLKDSFKEEDDENFTRGLSFDDHDDDSRSSAREGTRVTGLAGKAYTGITSFYQAVNSIVTWSVFPAKKKKEEVDDKENIADVQTVDDEFDFLNQELDDIQQS